MKQITSTLSAFAFILLAAGTAAAQAEDPAQHTEAAAAEAPDEDKVELSINLGGVFASGNTRAWTLTAGTHFGYVRGRHGFSLDWAFNYGRADLRDETTGEFGGYQNVARNSNARARYDFFVIEDLAIFAAVAHRWDTFAGLDTRLQAQVGMLYNFLSEDNHRIWAELGYDFTHDNFDPDPDEMGMGGCADFDAGCTENVHSIRAYLGYKNQLNEHVRFLTGVEGLLEPANIDNIRVNFDAAIQATLVGSLQLELKFKLLFDNVPVQGNVETDTQTSFSLLYTFI